jgi:hypothetical protein
LVLVKWRFGGHGQAHDAEKWV